MKQVSALTFTQISKLPAFNPNDIPKRKKRSSKKITPVEKMNLEFYKK